MVVCDGLKGLPDAVTTVWDKAIVQTCVVHLLTELVGCFCSSGWVALRSCAMIVSEGQPRDLAGLVVPSAGSLMETGDVWEPWRLLDPHGAVLVPVAECLKDLRACGRAVSTQRSYAMALLRWFRFLWAVGVSWDQATQVEARDFCCWIQFVDKPGGRTSIGPVGRRMLSWRNPLWCKGISSAKSAATALPTRSALPRVPVAHC